MAKYLLYTCVFCLFFGSATASNNDAMRDTLIETILEGGPDANFARYQLKQLDKGSIAAVKGATATIGGTITGADTMLGLNGVFVWLVDANGSYIQQTTTDPSGVYSFAAVAEGDYTVLTELYGNYIAEVYTTTGGYTCYRCEIPSSAYFNVPDGAAVSGIDLELAVGSSISGTVTSGGVGVEGLNVAAFNIQYHSTGYAITAADGTYTIQGLPDLEYRAYINRYDVGLNLISELYDNIQCNPFSCGAMAYQGLGAPLTIAAGVPIAGIDFDLAAGASISGVVNDSVTMMPITESFGFLNLFDETIRHQAQVIVYGSSNLPPDNTAAYTIAGLLPGDYFLEASERDNHVRELYPNQHCPWSGCQRGSVGIPITLGPSSSLSGIDFFLDPGGDIKLNITDGVNPLSPDNSFFQVFNASGEVMGGGFHQGIDGWVTARPLPAGNYFVRTGMDWGGNFNYPYVDELHRTPETDCIGYTCDVTTGTSVAVAIGAVTDIGTIDLDMGLSVSGTVTEIGSATPIPDVFVLFYTDDVPPVFAAWDETDAMGNFTVEGLLPGNYFALTNNRSNLPFPGYFPTSAVGWVDILYNSHPCPGGACDFHATGDLITVPTVSRGGGVIIEQPAGAQILGRVTDVAQGLPVPNARVDVWDGTGMFIAGFYTDENGEYRTAGLADGTYYLTTQNPGALVNSHYGGAPCSNGCTWSNSDPVAVTEASPATDIDFALLSNRIFGNGMEAQ